MQKFSEHKAWLKAFCDEFDWPEEAYVAHDEVLEKLKDNKRYFELVEAYFSDGECNLWDTVQELRATFKEGDIRSETAELLFFVLIARHLKEKYKKEGIDEAI